MSLRSGGPSGLSPTEVLFYLNKDKNQLMSFIQELCFLTSSFGVGVGVMAGPDIGTITGSMTAVPNGLAHVTVDVTVGMTVQLLHTAVGVMQCVTIGITHCDVDGDVHVLVLHTTDDVSHMHLNGEGVVLHIVVGDMQ